MSVLQRSLGCAASKARARTLGATGRWWSLSVVHRCRLRGRPISPMSCSSRATRARPTGTPSCLSCSWIRGLPYVPRLAVWIARMRTFNRSLSRCCALGPRCAQA